MNKHNVIKTVYEMKSISCAANKLNYTQSAVSQIIKGFEKEVGVKIFKRSKSGVELMPNAEEIMKCIIEICDLEEKINNISDNLTSLDTGYIRIGTIQSIAYNWLPEILDRFSKDYPNISFDIVVDKFDELVKKVKSNQLDIIFVSEYSVPDMNFVKLYIDELVLITPVKHKLSSQITVPISKLKDEKFILSADGLNYETGIIFNRNGIDPEIKYKVNEDFTVIKLVESGFGVAILPKLLLENTPFNVSIRNFSEHYNRVLGVAYSKEIELTPVVEKFINYVKDAVE
ncbi:LysR substrate-binding domain-containing protein [Peptacetobacter sp. AB800]|uniref:LysR substrate-binding domain-containing protein n=1 Tax=Peptacetobacter sp. AB800 TaxID=3388428 RepID=UPI002E984550|nr:LysR substrate-binding domain-containing protein [Peptacetobacter hiranonis]